MKISYNPKSSQAAITPQTAANDDIIFDLYASKLWAKGIRIGADWADISSKPSSLKNPAAITFKDVNGKVISYDGSVATDLTAGTYIANRLATARKLWGQSFDGTKDINGSIVFPAIGDTATSSKISWSGSSDGADIYYQTTAKEQGNLVLNVKDDTNAYIQLALNGVFKSHFDVANSYWTGRSALADKWTTARTFTIGNTAKNVDGSGNVSWSLAEIGVRDTWRTVQVNGTSIGNNTLNLCGSTYIGLTNVNGKVTFSLVGSGTTANQAILSNGTANGWALKTLNIANWDAAYNFVSTITGTDADNVINKWEEIVNFLAGITEDNKLNTLLNSKLSIQQLSAKDILTTKTNNALFWVNTKDTASAITTGPFTDHPYALLSVTNHNQNAENNKFFYRSRLAFSSAGDLKVASCHHENEYKQDDAWYDVLTSKNSGIDGSTIKLNGTSITVYSSGTADGRYVKKTGDTMTGALNFANATWNKVGDDSYVGDCNVGGHFGIRATNTAYSGIAFFNNTGAKLGNLTAYSGNIRYGAYSLQFLDNGNTNVFASSWRNIFSVYDKNAVKDGQAICVWGQSSSLSNLSSDTGNMSLWLKRVNANAATLNMILDGEYYSGDQRLAHVSEIPSSLKNPYALTLKANGTVLATYDGSSAKEANFTYANVGAASANHNHDDRYVRKWIGIKGTAANKFLKLTMGNEKGWIRLEVSESSNGLTGGYGIYMIGWGYHGDGNQSANLVVTCLYANNSHYNTALKVVETSRNNYDFYFQFAGVASLSGYTINYCDGVSIDCTVTSVNTIPTATYTSSLTALQLNASSATNADKLDGYHANGLFTGLSNSGNSIKVDIGGTSKTLQVNYANSAGSATSATKVIVNQHTANDINYPLVWSNQTNTNNVTENQLYKSWQDLYYNPKNKRLFVGGSVSTSYINATGTVTSAGFVHSSVTKNANQYVLTADGGYTFFNQTSNELAHEFSKDITVTDEWTDIEDFYGGNQSFLTQPGTYIVQVYYNDSSADGMYEGYFSGIMSWFTGTTNSNNADEIVLHRVGHAYANTIYLRTRESLESETNPYTKLQISANTTLKQHTYKFKFKRIC